MKSTTDSARIYEAVPQLGRIHGEVLLDILKQPDMSYRDRILVTCGVLAALGRQDDLKNWMGRGVASGITLDELRGLIVQVAFYAGWPAGLCAGKAAIDLFECSK